MVPTALAFRQRISLAASPFISPFSNPRAKCCRWHPVLRKGVPYRDQLLLIGVGAGDGFAEGSANGWLPLLMADGHGLALLRLMILCRFYPGMTADALSAVGSLTIVALRGSPCNNGHWVDYFVDSAWVAGVFNFRSNGFR